MRDKVWGVLTILCVLYFVVLEISGCKFNDGPFSFVRGCQNYGIDWNSFMAPIGFFIIILFPLFSVYWLLRVIQIVIKFISS
jgi:hypothetical protein